MIDSNPRIDAAARRLERERALFERRAALPAPEPPPFATVIARARADASSSESRAKRPRRVMLWSALAAAAALVLGFELSGRHPEPPSSDGAAAIVAEPAAIGEACRDPRTIAAGAATREEHARGACLMGTPSCAGDEDARFQAAFGDGCSAVTCGSCEPLPDEDLDPSPRGECAP